MHRKHRSRGEPLTLAEVLAKHTAITEKSLGSVVLKFPEKKAVTKKSHHHKSDMKAARNVLDKLMHQREVSPSVPSYDEDMPIITNPPIELDET